MVRLNRGDGLETILETPAKGWKEIHLKPVIGEKFVDVTLVGEVPEKKDQWNCPSSS